MTPNSQDWSDLGYPNPPDNGNDTSNAALDRKLTWLMDVLQIQVTKDEKARREGCPALKQLRGSIEDLDEENRQEHKNMQKSVERKTERLDNLEKTAEQASSRVDRLWASYGTWMKLGGVVAFLAMCIFQIMEAFGAIN